MKLSDLCEIKYNLQDADFYLIAKGSEKQVGKPILKDDNIENKIGIKVIAKDIVDPKYLYYLFGYLHQTEFWINNGLIYGTLNLKNIRLEDIKNIKFK